MSTNVRVYTPKTYLTLSVAPNLDREAAGGTTDLLPEDARAASHIDAELRRIRLARRNGTPRTARARLDTLVDYVWGPDGVA
jgi:hypothetical protein